MLAADRYNGSPPLFAISLRGASGFLRGIDVYSNSILSSDVFLLHTPLSGSSSRNLARKHSGDLHNPLDSNGTDPTTAVSEDMSSLEVLPKCRQVGEEREK